MATVQNRRKEPDLEFDWGTIRWLCDGRIDPEAQMTFGIVQIDVGQQNPAHYHPNCEEFVYILSGQCNHRLGDQVLALREGDLLRVPQGVVHSAVNTGTSPVVMAVVYSVPNRETVGEGPDSFRPKSAQ